jgi:hypothetical protein
VAAQAPKSTWQCPNCRRSVPRYVGVCHCGTRKGDAELIPAPGARRTKRWAALRGLPWTVWIWFAAVFAVVCLAAVWTLRPWQAPRTYPILGQYETFHPKTPTPLPVRKQLESRR